MKSLPKRLLYPSDIYVAKTPCIVSTILGSCISVCLHDSALGQGAINHYILPQWNGYDLATMKYGNMAIIRILEEMLKVGSKFENITAKVYGGAEVLTGLSANFHIGLRNTEIAFEILNEFKIPILFSEVGGNKGRKIIFNTLTGEVEHEFISHREKVLHAKIKENEDHTNKIFKGIANIQ
jgi:chemotaxis protein CheD